MRKRVWDKYSVSSVLRWMGSRGFGFEEALATLEALGFRPKCRTVKHQLHLGATGRGGAVAKIVRGEAKQMRKFLKEYKNHSTLFSRHS